MHHNLIADFWYRLNTVTTKSTGHYSRRAGDTWCQKSCCRHVGLLELKSTSIGPFDVCPDFRWLIRSTQGTAGAGHRRRGWGRSSGAKAGLRKRRHHGGSWRRARCEVCHRDRRVVTCCTMSECVWFVCSASSSIYCRFAVLSGAASKKLDLSRRKHFDLRSRLTRVGKRNDREL